MTDMRNRLIKLLDNRIAAEFIQDTNRAIADYLIENGAVLQNGGKWNTVIKNGVGWWKACSICGAAWPLNSRTHVCEETPYCPHCGAKMDGGENDGKQ